MREINDIEIFSRIDASRIEKIRGLFESRRYNAGTAILRYGESVDGLYLLEQGEVTVSIPGNTTPDVRFGASGSALQYIGIKGTEYSTGN